MNTGIWSTSLSDRLTSRALRPLFLVRFVVSFLICQAMPVVSGSQSMVGDTHGHSLRTPRPSLTPLSDASLRIPVDGDERWWDGFASPPDGEGLDHQVAALAVYDGKLVAGGNFAHAGGLDAFGIAIWDGVAWQAIPGSPNGRAWTLAVYRGDLIAGGDFMAAGGHDAFSIARWDGEAWHPLGDGLLGEGVWVVETLCVHGEDLIVGGMFTFSGYTQLRNVARWDGTVWHPMGPGLDGRVNVVASCDGELYAGGLFDYSGGVPVSRIARWDGAAWNPVGGGVSGGPRFPHVQAIVSHGGKLVVGGAFTSAGGVPVSHIASWDGASWTPFGDGVSGIDEYVAVHTLHDGSEGLIIGGEFTHAGAHLVNSIARWTGTDFEPLGSGLWHPWWTIAGALIEWTGDLYVGGFFVQAGLASSSYIARWRRDPTGTGGPTALDLRNRIRCSNPVRADSRIDVFVADPGHVRLDLVDCLGRSVGDRLLDGWLPSGSHSIAWSTVNRSLPAGGIGPAVYWLCMTTDRCRVSRKVVLIEP